MQFTSNKPYLIRAIYDWVVDNDATPHIVLFAENPEVVVPQQFVEDGRIVLNISPTAAQDLLIDSDGLSFSARFGGKPFKIYSPLGAVLAIYASENSEGMSFELDNFDDLPPEGSTPDPSKKKKSAKKSDKPPKRPALKVVK
jgi:stringent starvation protein B